MLVDIKERLQEKGCTEEEAYSGLIAYIVASNNVNHVITSDDVAVFEWRTTLRDADSFRNHLKAYEEELLCLDLSDWCAEHGMLFRSDVGKVEESEFTPVRGFDHRLLMPGREYLRILGEDSKSQKVNVKVQ